MADSLYLDSGQSVQSGSGICYRNLQVLGTGGNAVTFLGLATSGEYRGLLVAIKVFRKLSRPERREGFLSVFAFLRGCNHPGVLRVHDFGTYRQDNPFYVAEYLPDTLAKVIRAGDTSTVQRLSFALQLLSAIHYLDRLASPVVHRDIKPQNIFVEGRSAVLGDFGLLKHVNQQTPEGFKESVGAGMPFRYRSPDQVAYLRGGAPLSTKSDVFQLGLVLAELFTGRNPQRPTDDFESDVQLEPLGAIRGSLRLPIADAINAMLEYDPGRRLTADRLLEIWKGIFMNAVQQAHQLEGRAIW
jgi:serine/threonine-protein kinase